MPEFDTIVVGAGLAGLATAIYAAKCGDRVLVLERSPHLGGRAATRNLDGYRFNRGAHALYQGGATDRALRRLGVAWSGKGAPLHAAWVESGGRLHRTPTDPMSMFHTTLLGAADKLDLAAAMGALALAPLQEARSRTTAQWVERAASSEPVRSLLKTLLRLATYTDAPDTQSAAAAVSQFRQALFKEVIYLDGGWQTLVDGLREQAWTCGVEIRSGCAVSAVRTGPDGVVGVDAGAFVPAGNVVVATPPGPAARIIGGGLGASIERHMAAHPPVMAACLDLGLRALPSPEVLNVLSLDEPLYLSVHSASADLAPDGGALIQCIRYVQPGTKPDPNATRAACEALLDRTQAGWRDQVAHVQWLPRIEAASCVNLACDADERFHPVTNVPGLYIAADWTGQEGVLADAAFSAAELVGDELRGRAQHRSAA